MDSVEAPLTSLKEENPWTCSMTEEALKLDARLGAIEYALCELFSVVYAGLPATQIHARHDRWTAPAREQSIQSDQVASELKNALHDLSRLIEAHVQKPRQEAEKS